MKSELPLAGACRECFGRQDCLVGGQPLARREQWMRLVVERPVRKGEMLLQQGQVALSVRILKTGSAMLLRGGDTCGAEQPVAMLGAGQAIGITSLLSCPAPMSCRALAAGRVCEVQTADVSRLGLLDAEFLTTLAQGCARTNANLAEWARIARIRGVRGQLAAALLQLAQVQRSTLVRLPSQATLAALLSTTRETIARSLRQIAQHDGVVRRDRWHCEIRRDELIALATGQDVRYPPPSIPPAG